MKILFIIAVTLFFSHSAYSQGVEQQTKTSANASQIYVEVGGPGVAYSVNYDGRFQKIENGLGIRIGLGGASSGGSSYFALPAQVNYLLGNNGQYLELGAGATYLSSQTNLFGDNNSGSTVIGSLTIGFRKQPFGKKGLTWRLAFTPLFGGNGLGFVPWGAASIGFRF